MVDDRAHLYILATNLGLNPPSTLGQKKGEFQCGYALGKTSKQDQG